jgi:hypothetical protein
MHPIEEQTSTVHKIPSSQEEFLGIFIQVPFEQVSTVQGIPSLQSNLVLTHPVFGLQTSMVQGSESSQS